MIGVPMRRGIRTQAHTEGRSCEDTRPLQQKRGAPKENDSVTLALRLLAFRAVRELISVVQAVQSVVMFTAALVK